jgi:hypothetical protein
MSPVSQLPGLPFVDTYSRSVAATPDRTWAALLPQVERMTTATHGVVHGALFGVLGTVPRSGFAVVETDPGREVVLGGRHRFSTYRLVFRVEPEGEASLLSALTYAEFPGLHGRAYRTMLMATTGHRRAAQRLLAGVARRAEG